MPELPEVEIVKQSLSKKITFKKIQKIIIKNGNLRFKIAENFVRILKNSRIKKISRFSKYLIIFLDNNYYCIIHLGMSGTVHIIKNQKKSLFTNTSFYNSPKLPKKHNHIEFIFDDMKLIYNDPRRFGFFQLMRNEDELKRRFDNFGPEPFSEKFNLTYLESYFKVKKKDIKNTGRGRGIQLL